MPKMNISRSIEIDAPASKVFTALNDFNNWIPWSPWLISDPEAKVNVAEDAKSYDWEGKRVGVGNMKVLKEEQDSFIEYDLNFLKPWKSHAITAFDLQEKDGKTQVTWKMDSGLPFFMFFMKKMMETYVGADYERGLDMLKAYVEDGAVPSQLEFKGASKFDGCNWVGVKKTCKIDDTVKEMPKDFALIRAYAEKNGDNVAGEPFSIYHKWDLVKNSVSYTAAIPVKDASSASSDGFVSGNIPSTNAYVLRHVGRYQHLGNAWSTLYNMNRSKEIRHKKAIHPFEIYRNNPHETPEKELITDIYFAVK